MLKEICRWLDPQGSAFWRLRVTVLAWITILAAALIIFSAHEKARHILFVLDWCNVVMHEAGHPVFGILGNRWLMMAGGTLMQLLMPSLFYFYFLRNSQPKSADVCLFWFGSNFLGIGPYIADARTQALDLIGGGEHDWTYLLGSLGLLARDTQIGASATFIGCFVMAFSIYSLYIHWDQPAAA
jgi:hypothetical protein